VRQPKVAAHLPSLQELTLINDVLAGHVTCRWATTYTVRDGRGKALAGVRPSGTLLERLEHATANTCRRCGLVEAELRPASANPSMADIVSRERPACKMSMTAKPSKATCVTGAARAITHHPASGAVVCRAL